MKRFLNKFLAGLAAFSTAYTIDTMMRLLVDNGRYSAVTQVGLELLVMGITIFLFIFTFIYFKNKFDELW